MSTFWRRKLIGPARPDATPHPESVDLAVLAADAGADAVAIDQDRPITLDAPMPVVISGDGGGACFRLLLPI